MPLTGATVVSEPEGPPEFRPPFWVWLEANSILRWLPWYPSETRAQGQPLASHTGQGPNQLSQRHKLGATSERGTGSIPIRDTGVTCGRRAGQLGRLSSSVKQVPRGQGMKPPSGLTAQRGGQGSEKVAGGGQASVHTSLFLTPASCQLRVNQEVMLLTTAVPAVVLRVRAASLPSSGRSCKIHPPPGKEHVSHVQRKNVYGLCSRAPRSPKVERRTRSRELQSKNREEA